VFIDEEKNVLKLSSTVDRELIPKADMQVMSKNVVININYYIAKYDFDIGNKIRPNNERR
jgi:predicted Ser/Thr protein kinase